MSHRALRLAENGRRDHSGKAIVSITGGNALQAAYRNGPVSTGIAVSAVSSQ
jgi:hypothetical protein